MEPRMHTVATALSEMSKSGFDPDQFRYEWLEYVPLRKLEREFGLSAGRLAGEPIPFIIDPPGSGQKKSLRGIVREFARLSQIAPTTKDAA